MYTSRHLFLFLAIWLAMGLYSCNSISTNKDFEPFIGNWELANTGNEGYKGFLRKVELKIEKKDIFYVVNYTFTNTENTFSFPDKDNAKTKDEIQVVEMMERYQLSPDKHFLINVADPKMIIQYKDNEEVIHAIALDFKLWLTRKK